jgi:hypothetical protein
MIEAEPSTDFAEPRLSDRGSPAPILVTGAPRSGSTWVGNVLALDRGAASIHEPFNQHCPEGRCRAQFRQAFTYVTKANEAPYVEALRDTIAWNYSLRAELKATRSLRQFVRMSRDFTYFEAMRRSGARTIVKDPMAVCSADWMAERFGMKVVVIIRHPAAFTASLRAAGWGRVHFSIFDRQPALVRERLQPYAARIAQAAEVQPDPIDSGALLWTLLHHHMLRLREEHPDWIFVRHEDVARDPEREFASLYDQLGLDFSEGVRKDLRSYTTEAGPFAKLSLFGTRRGTMRSSQGNISAFRRRLAPEELDRVYAQTWQMAAEFGYGPADW